MIFKLTSNKFCDKINEPNFNIEPLNYVEADIYTVINLIMEAHSRIIRVMCTKYI